MTRRFARLVRTSPFIVAAALAACSSSTDSNGSGNPPAADVSIVRDASLKGFQAYSPDTITVSLGGAPSVTVVWRNDDKTSTLSVTHTVRDTLAANSYDTGFITGGATDSLTFNAAGNYPYKCGVHNGMRGLVIVQP